jgi:superfamily I DNA and/or RNA helicase
MYQFAIFITKSIREILIRLEVRTTELFTDESAQVAGIDFFPFIYHYDQIQKLVLLGDPNQLPPHGTTLTVSIRSIFECFKYTGGRPIFLKEQRRTPGPIARIQSEVSYKGELETVPAKDNIPVGDCLFWNDIQGQEEKQENSWINKAELDAINLSQHGNISLVELE